MPKGITGTEELVKKVKEELIPILIGLVIKATLCLEIYKIKLHFKRILKSDYSPFRNKNTLQTEIRWFHDAQMDILWAWRNSSYKLQQGLHHKVLI